MSYKNKSCSLLLIPLKLLLLLILDCADMAASSSCERECGGVMIKYPFGIGSGCYLDKSYEIECRKTTTATKVVPFLSAINKEVVNISLPSEERYFSSVSFGYIRVRILIASAGCSKDGKDLGSIMNFTGSPFFIDGMNSLVAVGCNSSVSLTNIKPNKVGCDLNCSTSKEYHSNSIPFFDETGCSSNALSYTNNHVCTKNKPEETGCNGNGCCQTNLPGEPQQVIGIRIERNDGNSTTREHCRVAFLTDEVYTLSNATKPDKLFAKRYATVSLGWVIQTKNISFLNSLACKSKKEYDNSSSSIQYKTKCYCESSIISEINYANCGCSNGYTGNPYILDGCKDINECESNPPCGERETCENSPGNYHCVRDKMRSIVIGVGAGFGVLVLVGGVWWLRKFLIKRRITKRKKKFFKRNGGLLLQQELNTQQGNVEKKRVFSSRELERATQNFRVLGQGGQGTVYKVMVVDGRTVAVKKSKVIDEDKLQEFINEVVILSQINH